MEIAEIIQTINDMDETGRSADSKSRKIMERGLPDAVGPLTRSACFTAMDTVHICARYLREISAICKRFQDEKAALGF